jgi:hypothetical protein
MFAALRAIISTRRPEITTRAKVNLIGSFGGPERTDGVVEAMYGDRAYVEWPNGARSLEHVRHLTRITG